MLNEAKPQILANSTYIRVYFVLFRFPIRGSYALTQGSPQSYTDIKNKHILSFFPSLQWPENTQKGNKAEILSPLATVSDVTHIWIIQTQFWDTPV